MGSCIEIRILGRLRVRRPDGTIVDNAEWRTGKTADLVRLLALAGGRPVRVDTLLDSLWPSVDETKARASLRTAASQIRRTLGVDCLDRGFDGLALTGAWIDAEAFSVLAHEARAHARGHHHAQVVRIAREAEALYVDDIDLPVSADSRWVQESRENLATLRGDLLADAAESALQLRWYRDAEDFARRALRSDRMAERPHRLLMSAYAGLGETERALRVYDRCRRVLADELGIDPSPMTQALHLQLLTGGGTTHVVSTVAPPETAVDPLVRLVDAVVRHDGAHFVGVRGEQGAGRIEIIAAMCDRLAEQGWQTVRLDQVHGAMPNLASHDDGRPVLVTLPCINELSWHRLEHVVAALSQLRQRRVVAVAPLSSEVLSRVPALSVTGIDVVEHAVGSLDAPSLDSLAVELLGSPVSSELVSELQSASDGLFGRAVATLHTWLAAGRVVSTSAGLTVTDEDEQAANVQGSSGWAPLSSLLPADTDLAATLAALRGPVSSSRLTRLLTDVSYAQDVDTVLEGLDRLVDCNVLRVGPHGYEFRHPSVRDAAENWLRPSARMKLHRSLARSEVLKPEDRATQWSLAGEPVRAVAALLDAASLCHAGGQPARASILMTKAFDGATSGAWAPDDQLDALETVGQTAARLGCPVIARQSFERGAEVAVTSDPDAAARLQQLASGVQATPETTLHLVPAHWSQNAEEHLQAASGWDE